MHSNKTENFNLPQWVGKDVTSWIGDLNPAFSTIDTALQTNKATAATALEKANSASETAASISETAQTALDTAQTAQSTAQEAQTTAQEAQSTAQEAQSTAQEAQSTAQEAQTTAQTAQSTAQTAQTTATSAQTTAVNAKNTLDMIGVWIKVPVTVTAQNSTGSINLYYNPYLNLSTIYGKIDGSFNYPDSSVALASFNSPSAFTRAYQLWNGAIYVDGNDLKSTGVTLNNGGIFVNTGGKTSTSIRFQSMFALT